ncbi:MAG: methyltransferase domain-containing protein, partial [Granulosicoccaceae bacterium]
KPVPVEILPGFAQGAVSVQDSAAQFATRLLDPQPGQRVLDACAAPGGKTAHLLERAGGELEMTALDANAQRLQRVDENMARLGFAVRTTCADAAKVETWWDGLPFDCILLDAPCTGTGVIRRHPDIKLLRRQSDVAQLVGVQAQLLDALWPCLARDGLFLYATCSVLRDENDRQIEAFLARTPEAEMLPVTLPIGTAGEYGQQILPGEGGADGFFYSLLRRVRSNY